MKTIMKQLAINMHYFLHDAVVYVASIMLFLFFRLQNVSYIPMIRTQNISLAEVIYVNFQTMSIVALLYVPIFLLVCRNISPRYYDVYLISKTNTITWTISRFFVILMQATIYAIMLAIFIALSVFPAWFHGNNWADEGFVYNAYNLSNEYLQNSVIYEVTPHVSATIQFVQLICMFTSIGLLFNWFTLLTNQWIGVSFTLVIHFFSYAISFIPTGWISNLFLYRYFFLVEYSTISQLVIAGGVALIIFGVLVVLCQRTARRYKWYTVK